MYGLPASVPGIRNITLTIPADCVKKLHEEYVAASVLGLRRERAKANRIVKAHPSNSSETSAGILLDELRAHFFNNFRIQLATMSLLRGAPSFFVSVTITRVLYLGVIPIYS